MQSNEQLPLSHYRLAACAIRQGLGAERTIWIAGEIHKQEVQTILETFVLLRNWHPSLLLVINPHNPANCGEIHTYCHNAGLKAARHSEGEGCRTDCDIYLLDTAEELGLFYLASDAAFIGASLIDDGYPDPSLPARAGLPLVAGPYSGHQRLEPKSSRLAARLERMGSLRRGSDSRQIAEALRGLLVNGQLGRALGECARRAACRASSSRTPTVNQPNRDISALAAGRSTLLKSVNYSGSKPYQGHAS